MASFRVGNARGDILTQIRPATGGKPTEDWLIDRVAEADEVISRRQARAVSNVYRRELRRIRDQARSERAEREREWEERLATAKLEIEIIELLNSEPHGLSAEPIGETHDYGEVDDTLPYLGDMTIN